MQEYLNYLSEKNSSAQCADLSNSDEIRKFFKLFMNPTRLQIFILLMSGADLEYKEIAAIIGCDASNISHQVAELEKDGLLEKPKGDAALQPRNRIPTQKAREYLAILQDLKARLLKIPRAVTEA